MRNFIKIGIDEAGRGPWFWPVSACALAFDPNFALPESLLAKIRDSKAMTPADREIAFAELIGLSTGSTPAVFFGLGLVDAQLIDEIGIKKANREAMRRAVVELMRKIQKRFEINSVVVDGNDGYQFPEAGHEAVSIVKGDSKVFEISAASVIAKVFRDKIVDQYALLYPEYGFDAHKGYGTARHQGALSGPEKVTGAHRLSYAPVKRTLESKPKLLLHVCCGPDATVPVVDLKKEYEVTCFWYDPNIQPKKEYDKRLSAFKKVCEIEGVECIEGPYDVDRFLNEIKGLEQTPEMGEKCEKCYDFRIFETAKLAASMGIAIFTTTLNTSPKKCLDKLFASGERYAQEFGLEYLPTAFRKNGGFDRSVAYCKLHGIFRQTYCGCAFSETYPGKGKKNAGGEAGFCG